MRVRNVIFDIGNVLLSFRPKEYLRSLGFSEEEVELYSRIIYRSSLWLDLDRGLFNEEEAEARLAAKHPKHAQGIERVFADWYAMFVPLEGQALAQAERGRLQTLCFIQFS